MRIACLLAEGFEDSEFSKPYEAFKEVDYDVTIIGINAAEELTGERGKQKVMTERGIDDVNPEQFQALLIPGGHSPDKLRADNRVISFVQKFYDLGRPIMAICHGPQQAPARLA